MSLAFEQAFAFTIKAEGGFVLSTLNHDSGGQTYAGIARAKQPQWPGWVLIDSGDTSSDQLHQMVKDFYFQRFWVRPNFEQLPPRVSALAFDFSVNSGDGIAIKILQRELLITDDGKIGPTTASRAQTADPQKISTRYLMSRLEFLDGLQAWQYFSKGWANRIVAIGRYITQ